MILTIQLPASSHQPPDQLAYALCSLLLCSLVPLLPAPLLLCSLVPLLLCSFAPLLLCSLSPALCSPALWLRNIAGSPLRSDLLPALGPPALWLRNIAGSPLRSDMLPALLVLSGVDVCSLLIYCYFYPFINY